MPRHIAIVVILEQNANDKLLDYLDNKAEKMLLDVHFWHKITESGNPITNLKIEMIKWINNKNSQSSLVDTKQTPYQNTQT